MKKSRKCIFIFSLILPLMIGIISSALSFQGMKVYESMNKPPLSPPAWVFPVAWSILYLMMGIASYFVVIAEAESKNKKIALILYAVQLAINFCWSILFFRWNMKLLAFVWLIILLCIVIICVVCFLKIRKLAAYFLIPYSVWLTFAAYLNLGAYLLN